MKTLTIIDPNEALTPDMDTSLLLLREAASRGHAASVAYASSLFLEDGVLYVEHAAVHYTGWPLTRSAPQVARVDSFDLVLARKDPPFDTAYLDMLWLLDFAGVPVVNEGRGIRLVAEKLSPMMFPGLSPKTCVSAAPEFLRDFVVKTGKPCVLKKSYLMGGQGIFQSTPDDPELLSIAQTVTDGGRRIGVAQEMLPVHQTGDTRVFCLDDRALAAMIRHPPENDFRANIHRGATFERVEVTGRLAEIVDTIAPTMRSLGVRMYCIDVIAGLLTEINVTSPSGVPELNQSHGARFEVDIYDWLEQVASEHRGRDARR